MGLAFVVEANAQFTVNDGHSDLSIRTWNQGPLTWKDFQGQAPENSVDNWLEYSIEWMIAEDTIGKTHFEHYKMVAVVLPSSSWVDSSARTTTNLHYNQVIFNLAEIQCRCFQSMLDKTSTEDEMDSIIRMAMAYATDEEQRFSDCCNFGADSAVVESWLDSTSRMLKEMTYQIPATKTVGWGMGAHLGMGYTYLGKGLSAKMGNPIAFDMGFEFLKGRSSFLWEILIGGARSKSSFVLEDDLFVAHSSYTWMSMSLGYAFYALMTPTWNVAPFVGVGLEAIGVIFDDSSVSDICASWYAGVMADLHLHRSLSIWNDCSVTSARLGLYASHSNLQGIKCVSLNMLLALNFSFSEVKFK